MVHLVVSSSREREEYRCLLHHENHDCRFVAAANSTTMNLVAAAATAVAVALCAACAVVAVPVPGRRRDAPEEDQQQHHHHHHHNNNNTTADLEVALVKFLDVYYDRYVKPMPASTSPPPPPEEDIYEQMQSDQPVTHNPEFLMGNGSDYASMKRG